jgi:serine/threonine-protein kinase
MDVSRREGTEVHVSSFSKNSEGALAAGQMLGRYELLTPIGRGGMGNVWAARLRGARGFRKLFAVKTILNVSDHPRLEQMLFDEATLASQIQHPNVVETIELGEHEGQLYLVMDLVDGESLSFILRKALPEGGVPLPVAVNLVGQVCRGLQAAHDLTDDAGNPVGLVHRDISPPNVLVTYSGTVKIVDFGVAITSASKTFDSNEIKGKVSYFAPEQLRAQPLDARVDVFAATILLYLLTTNRHPFRGSSESDTINRILSSSPVTPPSVFMENFPEALESVLLRGLEKERDRRYASAAALLEALERAFPSAFGPAGDKVAADYVQALLRERMLERRHALRATEDAAESSSPRASVLSVPAVASAHLAPARAPRSSNLAWSLSALTLVASLLTLHNFTSNSLQAKTEGHPGAQTRPAAAAPAARESAPAHGAASRAIMGLPGAAVVPTQVLAPLVVQPTAHVPARAPRAAARSESDEARAARPPAEPPKAEEQAERSEGAALTVGSGLGTATAVSALTAVEPAPVATQPPPAPILTASANKPAKPVKVRQVASRLGHARLAVNPLSGPYRVHVPPALQRTGQDFEATVNICVAPNGSVSSVKIVRSAGLMIDTQVTNALSRWRYRPLVENEQATPFCYVLRYQFASR